MAELTNLFQFVVIGLAQGATFALLAVGLTLIYGILHVLNFAHGAFAVLGSFFVYGVMVAWGLPYWVALALATLAVAAIGLVVVSGVLLPLFERGASELSQLLAMIGVGVGLERLLELFVGGGPRTVPVPYAFQSVSLGPVTLNRQRFIAGVIAAVLVVAVHLLVRRTSFGKQMRAVAQNRVGAILSGVNLRRVYMTTFVLGAALAAAAGGLVLPAAPITPGGAIELTIKAFIVVIVGGLGNIVGATIVGLALGVVEALGAAYWQPVFAPVIGYLFMILMLLYRPQGLLKS
jgi:branched-chain amino acid transport system permease protein